MVAASKKRGPSIVELMERFKTREDCVRFLENLRWPNGPICPKCKSQSISHIQTRLLWECNACHYQFSVTVGTIFHGSHLPLQKWIIAAALICNAKKGISAKQIERDLKVTYKTAWYLMHRIRKAMNEPGLIKQFTGVVEADETYIGGKREWWNNDNKIPVVGVRERGGEVRAEMVERRTAKLICDVVRKYTSRKAEMLVTDEYKGYRRLKKEYNPQTICHFIAYVDGDIHTNGIESFWNILKRGIVGSYHKVSIEYLPLYLKEFTYRFSHTRNGNGVGLWKDVLRNGLIAA